MHSPAGPPREPPLPKTPICTAKENKKCKRSSTRFFEVARVAARTLVAANDELAKAAAAIALGVGLAVLVADVARVPVGALARQIACNRNTAIFDAEKLVFARTRITAKCAWLGRHCALALVLTRLLDRLESIARAAQCILRARRIRRNAVKGRCDSQRMPFLTRQCGGSRGERLVWFFAHDHFFVRV